MRQIIAPCGRPNVAIGLHAFIQQAGSTEINERQTIKAKNVKIIAFTE